MAKEICISSTPHETRLAILEDDQLAEIYYERENEYTLAGSIYNGRVTRVLPGMQSAFVDIGLERDAFLYVTDFLELEDQEESDELEKAAASSGNQPPREVRHTNEQDRGQRGGQRPDRRPEREAAPTGEGALQSVEPALAGAGGSSEAAEEAEGSADEAGAKRWRGRRRRRGGRGGSNVAAAPAESQEFIETHATQGTEAEQESADEIHASASAAPRAPRTERAPEPFVLPGESLSRYGGTPAETPQRREAPARPASTYKPATLIEAPLAWDGSGLLPGESLSRHRGRQPESAPTETNLSNEDDSADEIEEQEFVEEMNSGEHEVEPPVAQSLHDDVASVSSEEDMVEETFEARSGESEPHAVAGEPVSGSENESVEPAIGTIAVDEGLVERGHAELGEQEAVESESTELDGDRSASHSADPFPPTGFRLFGLGGKKKKSDEEPPAPPARTPEETRASSAPVVSAFAPGSGLIEEEVIEGEEYDLSHRHQHKAEEHDLEDYEEEEKLHTQIRSGELGEMLQEAHLDHRIQMKFEDKNGEEARKKRTRERKKKKALQPRLPPQAMVRERNVAIAAGAGGVDAVTAEIAAVVIGHRPGGRGPSRRSAQTSDLPIISDLLKPGQEILVQIAKEPIAKKGARITSHIALPGRFLVFMPTVTHVGVSRKIASDEERQRLKRILIHERGDASGGFIVRTAAEGASEEELRADLRFLIHLWNEIKQRSDSSKSPALIYHDLSLIERILRDQVSANFSSIWVDSEADYERIVRFLNRFSPSLVRRVKLYTKETPLFEHFGIQDEISKALRSKVWLKSGGSIVINQTEALVAIDINTGKYVGKTARLEDTIVKTNLDAIPEIVRQIRLRDLGGIIVIDFIDMDERKNRFKVMAALEEALKNDRAPTKVLQFNDFGLVAITRKRVKQSLERTLSGSLPHLPGHRHGEEPGHRVQRDLHRVAQDAEALRKRGRAAARES